MNMKEQNKDIIASQEDYKYDFKDEDVTIFNTGKGLSEEVIREISKTKEEQQRNFAKIIISSSWNCRFQTLDQILVTLTSMILPITRNLQRR